MLDEEGYRPNVGIIVCNQQGDVLWAKRRGQHSWQFPQGGINPNENPEQAMYRELYEEIGLRQQDVEVIAMTKGWLRYKLPKRLVRWENQPVCIGQKQKWFLLKLINHESNIDVNSSSLPEFDHWRWVSYWYPIRQVVAFKKDVYRRVLKEFNAAIKMFQVEPQQSQHSIAAKRSAVRVNKLRNKN